MVFADALTKAGRLVELQLLFWASPGALLSTTAIAAHLGIAPRTARKYLTEMSGSGRLPVYRDDRGWRLVEEARLEVPPVRFLLEEAAAVYLAARLLIAHADEPNPAVAAAVAKLAKVVPHELRLPFQHLADRLPRGRDDRFTEVFRAVAYGWALRRVVRVTYAPRSRPEPFDCDLRPYLVEPSAVGSALYAIGRVDPPGEVRVLKLERMRSARLLQATFNPPPEGELLGRLDRAWGIWLSDGEPVAVRLRFAADTATRVAETRWHPTQRLERRADGGVDMELRVASTVEILPWILGWGSRCEVLSPPELRAEVAAELSRAARAYGSPAR